MTCDPEVAKITQEFESSNHIASSVEQPSEHHEQSQAMQIKFAEKVSSLRVTIMEYSNLFLDNSQEVLKLDSRGVVDPAIAVLTVSRKVIQLAKSNMSLL